MTVHDWHNGYQRFRLMSVVCAIYYLVSFGILTIGFPVVQGSYWLLMGNLLSTGILGMAVLFFCGDVTARSFYSMQVVSFAVQALPALYQITQRQYTMPLFTLGICLVGIMLFTGRFIVERKLENGEV